MSTKKLTHKMLDTLMDCHEKELMNQDPAEVSTTPHSATLIIRKMLDVKPWITQSGKKIYGLFITDAAIEYLNGLAVG